MFTVHEITPKTYPDVDWTDGERRVVLINLQTGEWGWPHTLETLRRAAEYRPHLRHRDWLAAAEEGIALLSS